MIDALHGRSTTDKTGTFGGFALPTLVLTATILMVAAVSVAQTTVSIASTLRAQHWNNVAEEAAAAGVAYATSCLKQQGSDYWTGSLAPDKTCTGAAGAGGPYIADRAGDGATPRWRSTFAVAPPVPDSQGVPRTTATGTVQLLSASNAVTKQYVAKHVAIISLASVTPQAIPKVTTLPSGPADGAEVYYQVNRGDGATALWHLRYNAATTYWDFLGGPALYTASTAHVAGVSTTTFASFSPATSLTAPLAGDYDTSWGVTAAYAGLGRNAIIGLSVNGSTPWYPSGTDISFQGTAGAGEGNAAPLRGSYRVTNIGASQKMEVKYRVSNFDAAGEFYSPSLRVTPIRVK